MFVSTHSLARHGLLFAPTTLPNIVFYRTMHPSYSSSDEEAAENIQARKTSIDDTAVESTRASVRVCIRDKIYHMRYASYSSSGEEADLSPDTDENIQAHARKTNASINNAMVEAKPKRALVPVYLGDKPLHIPAKAVIVDGRSGRVYMTSSAIPASKEGAPPAVSIMYVSIEGMMSDMSAIVKATRGGKAAPSAIVFRNVPPFEVRLLLQFYSEILGFSEGGTPVTECLRGGSLDAKDAENGALVSLAITVGAKIFLDAMRGHAHPEMSMTKSIIESHEVFHAVVPYMVIPRMVSTENVPRDSVVLDGDNGVYVLDKSPPKGKLGRAKRPAGAIRYMPMAAYVNLRALYELKPNPKMVVFANVPPSAVYGMVSFYEKIVSQGIPSVHTPLEYLKTTDDGVRNRWLEVANKSGAKAFEIVLMRNL